MAISDFPNFPSTTSASDDASSPELSVFSSEAAASVSS
jgi:hypothetical protein